MIGFQTADQNQMIHFLKNVSMAGEWVQVVAFGGGALSLGSRLGRIRGQGAAATA